MLRVLFHGSNKIIKKPEYGFGNKYNDYGLGFYCTTHKKLAGEWAARKMGAGFINKYTLRDDRFNILDLTKPPFDNVLNWIALLMNNKRINNNFLQAYPRELDYLRNKYLIDASHYDAIIGYRADDAFYRFPESFIRSELTLSSLEEVYHAGNLGKQYVLTSKRAFKNIKFADYYEVDAKLKQSYDYRVSAAGKHHQELIAKDKYSDNTKMIDLVRNND